MVPVGGAGCTVVSDAGRVLRESEGAAEVGPILRAVQIGVFDYHDRLAASGGSFGEQRIEVVDGRQIRRRESLEGLPAGAAGVLRTGLLRAAHLVRLEIVQRHDAGDDRRQGRGNLRIAEIGNVVNAVDVQVVDGSV